MLLSNTMVYSLVCVLFYVSEASPEPRQAVEAGLLEMLGMPRRPRPIHGRPLIPPAMLQLYKRQTGLDIDTVALPLPGSLARNANTARSFLHTGETCLRSNFLPLSTWTLLPINLVPN
jgi:hypothetical protein